MASAEAVVEDLLQRPSTLATGRLLAIDGPAGSGKSTMAREVSGVLAAAGVSAAVVSLDDLYAGWTGLDESLETRVMGQLLDPLAAGRAARWQSYDWANGRFGDWHDLDLPQVLVLEGCGAGARLFEPYLTLLVWMESPRDTRFARVAERDGADVLDRLATWSDLEAATYARNDTRARADVRLVT